MNKSDIPVALTTAEAAKALNRKPQTLRIWSCTGTGPIRPIRINGRLAWSAAEIAKLLNGGIECEAEKQDGFPPLTMLPEPFKQE